MLFTVSKYLVACSRSVSWEETSEMKLVLVSIAGVVSGGGHGGGLEYYEMRPFPMPLTFFNGMGNGLTLSMACDGLVSWCSSLLSWLLLDAALAIETKMCFLRRNDIAIFFPKFSKLILS